MPFWKKLYFAVALLAALFLAASLIAI